MENDEASGPEAETCRGGPRSSPPAGQRTETTETFLLSGDPEARPVGGGEALPVFARGAGLGRFLVLAFLARGGMGEVYVAYDPELDRQVALKVLRGGWSASRAAQARLLREAQAAARLTHPNVVRIYDVGSVGDRIFVAMELIDGADLAAWRQAGSRTWKDVLRVFRDAGRGLAAAHAAGLVHRDFKAGNVLVADDGRVVVVDFGLALDVGLVDGAPGEAADGDARETALRLAGTPAYMAPEQLRGGPVDHRADQFGFCAALYEALYGEMPFAGSTPGELLHAIERGEVREIPPASRVPAWLRRILLRGLAADPAARFAGMAELLAALDRDPAAWRRRGWQAVALLALVAMAAGWNRWQARDDLLCRGAGRKLAGIWDDARRAEVRGALETAGGALAAQTWPRVEQLLDAYARSWTALHTEACEATQLRGEQSEQMLDLQVDCLEERLREVRAATDVLSHADGQVVRNAVAIARSLPTLERCSDRRALLARGAPAAGPARRERTARIRDALARGRVLESAGKYPEALALAEKATREADALKDRPLAAEARLLLAGTNGRQGRADLMQSILLEAVDLAQASRQDEVLARAMTLLILASSVRGDAGQAHLWGRLSGSALERAGPSAGQTAADRFFYLGMVANLEQQPAVALEHFQTFLNLAARTGARMSTHAALHNMGIADTQAGRLAEAAAHFRQALETLERNFGRDHPDVGAALYHLGKIERSRGNLAGALGHYRDSLALYDRLDWQGSEPAFPLTGLGETLLDLNRPAEAVPLLDRAVRLRSGQTRDPAQLALSHFIRARALDAAGGDRRAARREAQQALAVFVDLGDRARSDRREVEAWLAAHKGTP